MSRRKGELTMATTCPSGGALDIFIEPQLPQPLLVVFGETPAAETLAGLAQLTGFRVRIVAEAGLGALAEPGPDSWAVVATMGHYDEDALEATAACDLRKLLQASSASGSFSSATRANYQMVAIGNIPTRLVEAGLSP